MSTRPATALSSGGRFRTLRVSLTSIAVLALSGTLVFLPPQEGLSLTVSESEVGGSGQIVYGSVSDSGGEPVEGAVVKIWHRRNGRRAVDMRTLTDSEGLYRERLRERDGRYTLLIRLQEGSDVKTSRSIRLRSGWAIDASATVTDEGFLQILPLFHY